jgi:hypothetical protein
MSETSARPLAIARWLFAVAVLAVTVGSWQCLASLLPPVSNTPFNILFIKMPMRKFSECKITEGHSI